MGQSQSLDGEEQAGGGGGNNSSGGTSAPGRTAAASSSPAFSTPRRSSDAERSSSMATTGAGGSGGSSSRTGGSGGGAGRHFRNLLGSSSSNNSNGGGGFDAAAEDDRASTTSGSRSAGGGSGSYSHGGAGAGQNQSSPRRRLSWTSRFRGGGGSRSGGGNNNNHGGGSHHSDAGSTRSGGASVHLDGDDDEGAEAHSNAVRGGNNGNARGGDRIELGGPVPIPAVVSPIPPTPQTPYGYVNADSYDENGNEGPPGLVDFVDTDLADDHFESAAVAAASASADDDNNDDTPSASGELTVRTGHGGGGGRHHRSGGERGGSGSRRRYNRSLLGSSTSTPNQQRSDAEYEASPSALYPGETLSTPPTQPRNIRVGAPPPQAQQPGSVSSPQYNILESPGDDHNNNNASMIEVALGAGVAPSVDPESAIYYVRRSSVGSTETGTTVSYMDEEDDDSFDHRGGRNSLSPSSGQQQQNHDFYPQKSKNNEWMGRSVESLILGHLSRAPILQLTDDDEDGGDEDFYAYRRRSTASTFGGYGRRRSSAGSFAGGGRRGSLSLSGGQAGVPAGGGGGGYHGGTLANYYNNNRRRQVPTDVDRSYSERQGRRGSTTSTHTPVYRRRSSMAASGGVGSGVDGDSGAQRAPGGGGDGPGLKGGPNVVFTLLARENTGKTFFPRAIPATQCLRSMGGHAMFSSLDKPAGGMCTEVAFLEAAIDTGDWTETQTIISRLAPRIIGDPMANHAPGGGGSDRGSTIDDPTLPTNTPKFYAGGGRTGLERDAFIQAGGVEVLIRVFREKSFVGQEMAYSGDARDLSPEIVAARLAPCWNEALASLRELVFSVPSLVEERRISDNGEFLPFLFTLLSHQSCFDGAAALIEEILALLSQSPQQQAPVEVDGTTEVPTFQPIGRVSPPTTFFLGNVPNVYKLWRGFNCRQLAHFCRILALLVFEPEDRQILESPAVLKSLELLQLRRNRAVRAGRDSTVDMNQAILLGDEVLIRRLLMLLRVMNFAPALRRIAPYHVMAQYPFIADTLIMLGLGELENWNEIDRQEALARKILEEENTSHEEPELLLSELGGVADMLDGLSESLGEASNQIGHIIHVITAAQQAGVIVGRGSSRRSRRNQRNQSHESSSQPPSDSTSPQPPSEEDQESAANALRSGGIPVDNATIQGLASVAGILTDQVLVRRLYQGTGDDLDGSGLAEPGQGEDQGSHGSRHFINTPEDSANSLQFNAILLGSYQVEVLFVLCTLLGGRRKLDAQNMLERLGLVPVLDDMFQRLPWFRKLSQSSNDEEGSSEDRAPETQNGIHGPGCECTPESALCVQYLRLLHNFCARDCDNYSGRRLLLSDGERNFIYHGPSCSPHKLKPGLLSKIIAAFINETDESPYRFWLASCLESYLRGSSTEEQMFAAQSGLMQHLADDVSSDRLHCAGSLQTSFDLLGELSKGNSDVIRLLVSDFDEERFRKLMSVAAANLVDSNVFIRSLLLSLERLSAADLFLPLYIDSNPVCMSHPLWISETGSSACAYLTHSWWDAKAIPLGSQGTDDDGSVEDVIDVDRQSDWFPTMDLLEINSGHAPEVTMLPSGLEESVGHFGWVFTPGGESLSANTYLPNTVERLSWFLAANQARLLRDLLGVVDLRNINHENICCLNTAVVIAIFAHRRRQLPVLLEELRHMNDEEKETKRRTLDAAHNDDDVVDRAFMQAMRYLDLQDQRETPSYARIASIAPSASPSTTSSAHQIGDRTDVMRNFREVLWFWTEYYTHRGRDRLSLEFSSHLRFQEWNHVVSLLSADDGSPTALIQSPARLPRSPYQRASRVADPPFRGV